jgi:hypothetical protein
MQAASEGIDRSRAQLDYFRLSGEKGVTIDLEQPGFAFAARRGLKNMAVL